MRTGKYCCKVNNKGENMHSKTIFNIKTEVKRVILKYKENPLKAYFKILFYVLAGAFKNHFPKRPPKGNEIYIAFIIEGGLGDFLININFIHCLIEKVYQTNIHIDIITNSKSFAQSLIPDLPGLHKIKVIEKIKYLKGYYDLEIKIFRRPYILYKNIERIKNFAPQLLPFLSAWEVKQEQFSLLYDNAPYLEGTADILDAADGKKRFVQADIANLLNMDYTFKAAIKTDKEKETLQKFNLFRRTYITIAREVGYDKVVESTKLWPLDNYRELTKLIKQNFPNVTIAEIGAGKGTRIAENIDVVLSGKTSLEEAKAIIKNSLLHIDTEGGLSYLRHALHGGASIILMGPTDPNIYNLEGNICICSKACPIHCAELLPQWQENCHKIKDKNICMKSITVDMVFSEVKKILNEAGCRTN